jgi:breakpoint cluster region protein
VSAVFRTTVLEGETLVMRKLVVSGIVAAEKTYLTWLTILKENYRSPLLAVADSSHPILDDKSIRTIFYGIEELQELHSKLYKEFESRAQNWTSDVCVGDLFIELCKNLKHYRDYVEMSQKSLGQLKKSKVEAPSFKKFLEDAREVVIKTIAECPSVEDLLRKPIERLQSYSLVLNDLCQHTPEDHNDYRILRESLKAMSDFIASTHDPTSFKELSSSYNRQLLKESLMVELVDGIRKVRSLLLFQDVLVCAKQKRSRDSIKLELKWYLPLSDLMFTPPPDSNARQPVKATSDAQLELLKSRIAEVKAQLKGEKGSTDTLSTGSLGKRKGRTATKEAKQTKKLNELLLQYWVAQPSLPLRIFTKSGKNHVFVVHNEDIRETWITSIKKLQPKAGKVVLTGVELQDLLSKQKLQSHRDIANMPTEDEQEYLSGVLRVVVKEARDLKLKPNIYCALEVDEYGKFYRKARTSFGTSHSDSTIKWDEGFEIDLSGSHKMKVLLCVKQLLKEEVVCKGSCLLPIPDLRRGKRVKSTIKLHPFGVAELSVQYFHSHEAMAHKPALASSGVFGVHLDEVVQKENHNIPLLVETCVHEIERRGLNEVGIYRVAGVMRDVDELRRAFDTDYFKAQALAADTDIHAVGGLLKKYFRELPEPLFTTKYYTSFIQGYSLQDPDARDQCLISLLHSLPLSYYKTAVYLLEHLKTIAQHSSENKMTLLNLATVFGPNLIRPGYREGRELEATLDVMSQVGVLMYFLNLPSEMYDLIEWQRTSPSTLREILHGSGKQRSSSRPEGTSSRVEGTMSLVEGASTRVNSQHSSKTDTQ